jgi:hypothetical protein
VLKDCQCDVRSKATSFSFLDRFDEEKPFVLVLIFGESREAGFTSGLDSTRCSVKSFYQIVTDINLIIE